MAQRLKAPWPLLALDVLGCVMMLVGIIEHFAWFPLVRDAWRGPYVQPALPIGGLLLIMPYQFIILLEALKRRGQR